MKANYTIRYTVWDPTSPQPTHKQYMLNTDNDLLAAADEAMSKIYDDYPGMELLFRSIELNNAKEIYQEMTGEAQTL